jgi:DNA-binding Xre family transcriptional regulator
MFEMSISYNKLWKLLIDKKTSQADFRRTVAIS